MKHLVAALSVLALVSSSASAQPATSPEKLVVVNYPLENEIMISNHGSVGSTIKVVNVTINGRAECTAFDPTDEMDVLRGSAQFNLNFILPGVTPGARYWQHDAVTLQLGETVTVKNKCQGDIVRVKIDTDKGTHQFGY